MEFWDELPFFHSSKFKDILRFLEGKRQEGVEVLPQKDDILNAFCFTPYNSVKVVILSQDPYPNPKHAHGLAFSVPENIEKLPASLLNIYKELRSDMGIERPNGCLIDLAEQGVLLLNTSLTVESGRIDSHKNLGWKQLTKEVIQNLNDEKEHLVFILWGGKAQLFGRYLDFDKHCVITSAHPSPLSAYRGFFGSKPFSKTNAYLKKHKIEEVCWGPIP